MAEKPKSRGYAREWLQSVGLIQADLVNRLDYSKAKANAIWHGDQRLNEDILEEIASLVNAKPYELLMPPELAHQMRRLEAALEGVKNPDPPPPAAPSADQNVHHIRRRKAS